MAEITGIKYNRAELCDILGTALYGGIQYWATVEEVQRTEDGDAPKRVLLTPADHDEGWGVFTDDDNRTLAVTLNDLQRAIDLIVSKEVPLREDIRTWIASGDTGMIDADAADCIVQVACFRELVYG